MRWRLAVAIAVLAACSVRTGTPVAAAPSDASSGADLNETPGAQAQSLARSLDQPLEPGPVRVARPETAAPSSNWRPAPRPPASLPRWLDHSSLPRDTVENLAIRYGVPARKLRRWNGMSPTGRLNPRTPKDLRVKAKRLPAPRERLIHVAGPDDTWDSVARRYGVFDRHLAAWNREALGRELDPGESAEVWIEPEVYASILDEGPISGHAASIPPGAHAIGTPQAGVLAAGVQVPPGDGYERRYPNSTWGTTFAVRHLVETLAQFHGTSGYTGTLMLGSMSFRRGGKIGGHISHQSGRDIDIRLPVRPGVPASELPRGRNVDWAATWILVVDFAHSGAVETIFLDYGAQRRLYRHARRLGVSEAALTQLLQVPQGRGNKDAIVRHSKGHEGHIHVRFACGPAEPQCGA